MEECRANSLNYVEKCLEEAATLNNPEAMRILFALLIKFYEIKNCKHLWHRFKRGMVSSDFVRVVENHTLQNLTRHLQNFSVAPESIDLPQEIDVRLPRVEEIEDKERQLNGDQLTIYKRIVITVQDPSAEKRLFFLQADPESGKDLLLNTILDSLACKGVKTTSETFNPQEALLLPDGVSCYTKFQLPLDLNQISESLLDKESPDGKELSETQLIIWDEISMVNCHALNAVDRLMKSLKGNAAPFGGVCVLLSGDVKQLLPVFIPAKKSFEISFVKSTNWTHFEILHLPGETPNNIDERKYLEYLRNSVKSDLNNEYSAKVLIYEKYVNDVVDAIYGDATSTDVSHRIIFCQKITDCNEINEEALDKFAHGYGTPMIFRSFDGNITQDDIKSLKLKEEKKLQLYNGGILPFYKINSSIILGDSFGLPVKELALKKGVPIMLLRTLSFKEGLVYGTRLTVLSATDRLLQAKLSVGPSKNKIVLIPRLSMPKDGNLRWQFPVSLCFAMTMNKAPSQTFQQIGVYEPEDFLTQGCYTLQMHMCYFPLHNINKHQYL